MPIQFPIPSTAVQQTSPFGVGLQQAQGTTNELMQIPMLKERLQTMQQNRSQQQQMLPAKLEQMKAQAAQEQAQTGFLNQQSKFLPLKLALQAAQIQQSSSRFGPGYQMAKTIMAMPVAARAQEIQQNQAGWDAIINKMGKDALAQGGAPTGAMGLVSKMLKADYPDLYADKSAGGAKVDTTSEQYKAKLEATKQALDHAMRTTPPTGTMPQQGQTVPTQGQPTFTSTPESDQKVKWANQLTANQKLAGPQMNKRAIAAVQVEKWLHDNHQKYYPRIQNALSYAGAIGRGKNYADAYLNKNTDARSDLDWFQGTFVPSLGNQYKYIEGMGSTDSQRKEILTMIDLVNDFKSDPERARLTFNKMASTIGDLADADFQAGEPLNKGLYRKAYNLPKLQGDYIPSPDATNAQGQLAQSGQAGTVLMKTPDGKLWHIPADKVSAAKQRGATEIGNG